MLESENSFNFKTAPCTLCVPEDGGIKYDEHVEPEQLTEALPAICHKYEAVVGISSITRAMAF